MLDIYYLFDLINSSDESFVVELSEPIDNTINIINVNQNKIKRTTFTVLFGYLILITVIILYFCFNFGMNYILSDHFLTAFYIYMICLVIILCLTILSVYFVYN